MIFLCLSLFLLIHDASPKLFSIEILKSPKIRLVTSFEFDKAPSSSTITHLHGSYSFFNAVRMKRIMPTGDRLDALLNTHIIIVFTQKKVIMEVNTRMEVTF